jgi:hypothetical protein
MSWWANGGQVGGQNKITYFKQLDKKYIYSLLRHFYK